MNANSFCIVCVLYALLVLTILDCGDSGSSSQTKTKTKKPKKKTKTKDNANATCPTEQPQNEEFIMKMTLCTPNISVICTAKPSCFKKRAKLKTTAFVQRRNGQCLIESQVSIDKTLRFYVEAKRVTNAEGSRTLTGQQTHQRGKCLLKYICDKRYVRSITMECASVLADEEGNLADFQKERAFWAAPPNYKGFVHFSAQMSVSSDMRALDISSAKIFIPSSEQEGRDGQETGTIRSATKVAVQIE